MRTYNFANVIDDHLMGIDYVIRGTEYLSSTPKYNLLYDAFGWERPNYIHLPPVMRDATHKLSKRFGDPSYNDLLAEGFLSEALVNYIALLGWSPKENREKISFEELKELFSLEGLSKSPAIFDKAKLRWLNGEYIKEMSPETFAERARPWFEKAGVAGKYDELLLAKLLIPRVETFAEIPEKLAFLDEFEGFDLNLLVKDKMKTTLPLCRQILPALIDLAEKSDFSDLHGELTDLVQKLGLKNGQVLWTFRVAVTGAANTPGGASEMAELLGKERTVARLRNTLSRLEEAGV